MQIDFHSHILPNADHGSDGIETSLRQLALAKEYGMDFIVATPHFYPRRDSVNEFLNRRALCERVLREHLPEAENTPQILIGAEVQLCRSLDHMEEIRELCVRGTDVLLLELPGGFSMHHYEQTIESLLYGRKLTVVLAHIDRYDSNTVDLLLDMGCLAQLNASAFCHFRGRSRALHWAAGESVVALGSDIHGTSVGYREFARAKKRLGKDYDRIMSRTAELLKL